MSALDQTRTAVINGKTTEIRCLYNTGNNHPEIVIAVNDIVVLSKRFVHREWQGSLSNKARSRTQHAREEVASLIATPDAGIEAAYNIALDDEIGAANERFDDLEERLNRTKTRLQHLNDLKRVAISKG